MLGAGALRQEALGVKRRMARSEVPTVCWVVLAKIPNFSEPPGTNQVEIMKVSPLPGPDTMCFVAQTKSPRGQAPLRSLAGGQDGRRLSGSAAQGAGGQGLQQGPAGRGPT